MIDKMCVCFARFTESLKTLAKSMKFFVLRVIEDEREAAFYLHFPTF